MKIANLTQYASQTSGSISKMGMEAIFPAFGTKAPDVPVFDSEKGMFKVDEYTSANGNRYINYVGFGHGVAVSLQIGFYHTWTYMDKIQILIPDNRRFKVVKEFTWDKATFFDMDELKAKIESLIWDYAMDNLGETGEHGAEQVRSFVKNLTEHLMSQTVKSQRADNNLEMLKAYCRQMNLCRDFA